MHNKKSNEFNEDEAPELPYIFLFLWAFIALSAIAGFKLQS
jgi:hypothetical protein